LSKIKLIINLITKQMANTEKKTYIVWVSIEEKITQTNGDEDYNDTEEIRMIGAFDSLDEAINEMENL